MSAKRTPTQREQDFVEIARRYCKGETQASIAASLGVTQQQICNDLKVIRQRWQEACAETIQEAKARELAKIDELERTYWEAWQKSCEVRTIKGMEQTDDKEKKSVRQEERDGNPAFLAGVMTCIDRRCKLLGIDAPTKQELSGPGGGPIEVKSIADAIIAAAEAETNDGQRQDSGAKTT